MSTEMWRSTASLSWSCFNLHQCWQATFRMTVSNGEAKDITQGLTTTISAPQSFRLHENLSHFLHRAILELQRGQTVSDYVVSGAGGRKRAGKQARSCGTTANYSRKS